MPDPNDSTGSTTRRRLLRVGTLGAVSAIAGCASLLPLESGDGDGKVDDWLYEPSGEEGGGPQAVAMAGGDGGSGDVGLSAGGARDVNTFRRNVENDYLPIPSSLSSEGLFHEYYFDTGGGGDCAELFCPRYAPAVTTDPLSGETERYLTVGLDSELDVESFDRKRLDLVVVLDVSGSMSAPFSGYYYDQAGNRRELETTDRPKIDVATEAVADLTTHLRGADRLGMVTFNNRAQVAKPVRRVDETDMAAIREHIREDVVAGGGTNMSAGIRTAGALLDGHGGDLTESETRIVFLTDAMPNVGTTGEGGLTSLLEGFADRGVFTTFVGVGVDFNTEVVDAITSIRGANSLSVHSREQFQQRLDEQFEYMVTPLVFDLEVELEGEGYDLRKVYGTTAAEEATGRVLSANTLFPSPSEEGETQGGVILAKVRRTDPEAGSLTLSAAWEERSGAEGSTTETVEFPDGGPGQFANTGVRKAVLLSRYADLVKNWTIDARERDGEAASEGIRVPDEDDPGRWEQQSAPLRVSETYRERFATFAGHLEREMNAIGDEDLEKELDLLERLATYGE